VRVIVCGSRDWEGILAEQRIADVMFVVEMLARVLNSPLQVVHGGCPTGADASVDRWARRRDHEVIVYEAQWATLGKAAGPARNAIMAQGGADLCIAFLRNNSRGTMNMVGWTRARRIPTFIVDWDEKEDEQPLVPPCEVCGFSDWPEGGMHAARSIHVRQHGG
jgi:hypothetical protein